MRTRSAYLLIAGVAVTVVLFLLLQPERNTGSSAQPDSARAVEEQALPLAAQNERPSAMTANHHDVRENPREMLGSIYDADLAFRKAAQSASEDFVARLFPGAFTRWQAVHIDPDEFLTGSYLEEGSVPQSFTISPFPDQTFTVVETKYNIWDETESASWTGKLVATDDGTVDIGIVGVEQPGFVIRIFNGPQTIEILPTEMPEVYVSVELNPHGPVPNNY